MATPLQYNDIVIVEKGKHKGFVGFVDDEDRNDCVVLYDLTPQSIENGYIVVRETSVRKLTEDEIAKLQKRVS